MKIVIETIPHNQQRYETVGDWDFDDEGNLRIRVSETGSLEYNQLIAIHEIVEAILCYKNGIPGFVLDDFDKDFITTGDGFGTLEPGDSPSSPYRTEHCFASAVERLVCAAMGVSWQKYDNAVQTL